MEMKCSRTFYHGRGQLGVEMKCSRTFCYGRGQLGVEMKCSRTFCHGRVQLGGQERTVGTLCIGLPLRAGQPAGSRVAAVYPRVAGAMVWLQPFDSSHCGASIQGCLLMSCNQPTA